MSTPAYAVADSKSPLAPWTITRRPPGPHDVQIEIRYCGVCHSDIHQARGEWGGGIFPMVPGHEIVGEVGAVGSAVTRFKVGDRVGVGCFVDSCRECAACKDGEEQFCASGMTATYNSLERGTQQPTYGGYSTRIVVNEDYVLRVPDSIPLDRAAPLLCAGITTYSPLRTFGLKAGDKIAVVGLGGLGHMGVKIARAMGAHVTVLSTSAGKEADARRLGASDFVVTGGDLSQVGRFDLIINTVSAPLDYNTLLALLRPHGAMVLVGVPAVPVPLHAFSLILGGRTLAGSLIGGIAETQEMLDHCGQHGITSDVEIIPIQQINEAYERVLKSDVRYRFVIDMASLQTQEGQAGQVG